MNKSNHYQHFALDFSNNIINIKDVSNLNNQKYFCPYCKEEMITKCGKIRQWHFAHKTKKCSYDKYLHSIAEKMIMDWFNTKEHILLYLNNTERCDKYDKCFFWNKTNCTSGRKDKFDLKKYYSRCYQEYKYKSFIADLYCDNNNISLEAPIFIEIFVTHECSQEKKNSGIRIIELVIQSEEDILNIVSNNKLYESEKVRMYNFKRKELLTTKFSSPLQKYILHKSLKSYVDRNSFTCRNYNQRRIGIYEISLSYDDCLPYFLNSGGFYKTGIVKAYLDGVLKKDCHLCKWQAEELFGGTFCKLYKRCGNPKYCKDNDAAKCSMFRENKQIINYAIEDFKEYTSNHFADIWKKEDDNERSLH